MLERHVLELEWLALGDQLVPGQRSLELGVGVERGQQDHVLEGGEPVAELFDDRATIELASAVAVAVDGEQQLRLDLREAIDQAPVSEVGGCARPDRSD